MKKLFVSVILFLLICPLFAVSFSYESVEQEYDSFPMLEKFYNINDSRFQDDSFWDECKIEVITVSKEKPIYSWFGHSAILVTLPNSKPIMYDWGTFAFGKGFFKNFAKGDLWYNCSRSYGEMRILDMKNKLRTVSSVELDLTLKQKRAVISFLETNATPGYNTYLYKYFTDNCATRVRDLLSYITDGDFEIWAKSQKGRTLREETSRVVSCNDFVFWVFDFLEGPMEDRQTTRWDEMFLPDRLEAALLEYGKLGTEQSFYSDFSYSKFRQTPEEPQSNFLFSLVLSTILTVLALFGLRKNDLVFKIEGFCENLLFGILGSVLFFMMVFTIHVPVYWNINIVFINPLLIILAVLSLKNGSCKMLILMYRVFAGLCLIVAVLKLALPTVFIQQNWNQILTVFPYFAVHGFVKKTSRRKE